MNSALRTIGFLLLAMSSPQQASTDKLEVPCQNIAVACNNFSTNFYRLAASLSGNVVCSPVGLHITLSLLSYGAQNATLNELQTGLQLDDVNTLQNEFKSLMSVLNDVKDIDLRMVNAMYIQDGFQLIADFLYISADVFRSFVSNIDFNKAAEAANTINEWVKKTTKEKILNVVSSDEFDSFTRLVIINAIYFKGTWLNKFDTTFTQDRPFHVANTQTKSVPTMFKRHNYTHGDLPNINARFLEIPYLNQDFSMVIILPDEVDGLEYMEQNFSWEDVLKASRKNHTIELYLPKFKIEFMIDLKTTLTKMGMQKMFENSADFGRLSEEAVLVSSALQKAFIEVNEEGSEAAAVTVLKIRKKRMIDSTDEFIVDRPFMFSIFHKPTSLPLFLGRIRDFDAPLVKDEL